MKELHANNNLNYNYFTSFDDNWYTGLSFGMFTLHGMLLGTGLGPGSGSGTMGSDR